MLNRLQCKLWESSGADPNLEVAILALMNSSFLKIIIEFEVQNHSRFR